MLTYTHMIMLYIYIYTYIYIYVYIYIYIHIHIVRLARGRDDQRGLAAVRVRGSDAGDQDSSKGGAVETGCSG